MTRLIVLRGLPASGKTTEARAWVTGGDGRARVNRDELRAMMFGATSGLTHQQEKAITAAEEALAGHHLDAGRDVVVDDCNLRPKYVRAWRRCRLTRILSDCH